MSLRHPGADDVQTPPGPAWLVPPTGPAGVIVESQALAFLFIGTANSDGFWALT